MTAVAMQMGREPKAGRLDGEIPSSRPATVTTRDERLELYGHLSHEEKRHLRVLVDAAMRAREGLATSRHSSEVRTRCAASTGPFGLETRCRLWARKGERFCTMHSRRAAA